MRQMQAQIDALTRRLGGTGLPDATTPMIVTDLAAAAPASAVYQSDNTGITKAQALLTWTPPSNDDGTTITDGSHFQIRYRTVNQTVATTWGELAAYTWGDLAAGTWGNPLNKQIGDPPEGGVAPPGTNDGEWHYLQTDFDSSDFLVKELTPGVTYDFQIRAVDTSGNAGEWSAVQTTTTPGDVTPPSTPASPTVAGSRIAIQITHSLGKAGGGSFNIESDLHHLEVHAQYEPLFTPSDATRLGKVLANNGMMLAQIPVIQTFPIESTAPVYVKVIAVDEAGNKSAPSQAVGVTAELIDDAHISDLTVDKVTAGTINAQWLLGGSIKTATTGARSEMDSGGVRLYDPTGANTVNLDATSGNATIVGTLKTGQDSDPQRIVINPDPNGLSRIDLYDDSSTNHTTQVQFGTNFIQQLETNGTRNANGGKVQWSDSSAWYAFLNSSVNSYLWLNNAGQAQLNANGAAVLTLGADEYIQLRGKWLATPISGHSAVVVGFGDNVNATDVVFNYGATMADRINPICSVYSSDTTKTCVITSSTVTNFQASVNAGMPNSFHWWAYRSA
jgi:hypothetical protein